MQTSKHLVIAAIVAAAGVSGLVELTPHPHQVWSAVAIGARPAAARDVSFKSSQAAFDQGLGAFRAGEFHLAIPAFEFVITRDDKGNRLFAEFYLARIFADTSSTHFDPAKAYMLYQRIADEHADIDPDDVRRSPIVAKSLTAVALYVRDGLPAIGLRPDPERAIEYLRYGATFFNEPDAQFELARILLADETQRQTGLHFLQKLSRENHAPAQATFAGLLAKGQYVKPDPAQALGLVRMAVEGAAPSDRIWIEDIYQQIYCSAGPDVREKSKGFMASWRRMFAQPRSTVELPMALGRRPDAGPTRVCSNGERLDLPRAADASPAVAAAPPASGVPAISQGFMPSGVREPAGQPGAFGLSPIAPAIMGRPQAR